MKPLIEIIDTKGQENILNKPKHGGRRENSGRPLKYGEPAQVVRFTVPESKIPIVKKMVEGYLEEFR